MFEMVEVTLFSAGLQKEELSDQQMSHKFKSNVTREFLDL